MKKKFQSLMDFISNYNKIIFPVILIVVVALTVLIALRCLGAKDDKVEQLEQNSSEVSSEEQVLESAPEEVPLELNQDPAINSFITSYYNALALGDIETIKAVSDSADDKELILIQKKAKYIDHYPVLQVYSKPGYDDKSTLVYVYSKTVFKDIETEYPGYRTYYISAKDDGTLYFKNVFSDEEAEYISRVSSEDDVVDLNNRVVVEYNNVIEANPNLLSYLEEVTAQVEKDAGAELGRLHAEAEAETSEETPEEPEPQEPVIEEPEPIILYVKTTATVNVRASDSEKADKLGKASKGSKLQLLEQKANGWSKVIYEKKEGFIKSEFLLLQDSTDGQNPIGTVEATTTVNVRSQASETADKLGALPVGTSVSLFARENGWCKIDFNGQVGYVKEDYVK